ncbi:MAG: metalloregulator ArsR/SmtB family transcription factor [Pseudomonadota bacterium]
MKEGPDIALIGSLVGDPARANILTALMSGHALTATELAAECGVTPQTASSHLAKLEAGGLLRQRKQGRHRYFALSGDDVGQMLENMMGLAASRGHLRLRTGPRDPALRKARICYDHLAGEMGVQMLDSLIQRDLVAAHSDDLDLTASGRSALSDFGIDMDGLERLRRPMCKYCLDWSARRSHLAGSLGAALLDRMIALKWARRVSNTRIIAFTPPGETAFQKAFPVE